MIGVLGCGGDSREPHGSDGQPACYKVIGFEQAIRSAGGSLLHLPDYGRDLNLVEQVLAKLKALFRKAAARIKDTLWSTIGTLLDMLTPGECGNYLASAGS